jgi:hypothetical protein
VAQKIPAFFGTELLQKATYQADQPWNCTLDLIQCHIRLFFDQTKDKVLVIVGLS